MNPARWRGHLDKLLPKPSRVKKVTHQLIYQAWQQVLGETDWNVRFRPRSGHPADGA